MRLSLSNNRGWVIIRTVFFSLFYLYLWLVVKPHLIYYGCGEITNFPVFYKGWAFFNEVVPHPGGPIKYLSDFLSQLLYYSWAGALVLTVHALLICVFTGYYLKKIGITRPRIISIIPAFLLLITYNGYTYHFTTALALLAALVFACIYVRISLKDKVLNVLLFLFLAIVLYLNWQVVAPVSKEFNPQPFVVEKGEGVQEIAQKLKEEGLIKNEKFFQIFGYFSIL